MLCGAQEPTTKLAELMDEVYGSPCGMLRRHLQRPVLFRDVVDHKQRRDHVIIGMWRESEVLMPFNFRVSARELELTFE